MSKTAGSAPPFRPHLVRVETSRGYADLDLRSADEPLLSWEAVRILRDSEQSAALIGISDVPGLAVRSRSIRDSIKRTFDVLGAIVLGLIFLPLMLSIVLLLYNEGGEVIYRHRRIGRDGKMFECFKFRSMVPDAERRLRELLERRSELKAEWLRDHKLRNDPRITALGRFLRRTSLDELPQIWNVLRGDMSLVGPRPVVREELLRYGRCSSVYLSARPGITGLWQVTGRNDTDYRRRVVLDVYYVRKRSLLLDVYILLKTTRVVLGGGGAY
jgi:Undecaprenyl-phosphate galactose phosphotransferase WbaP